MDLSTMTPVQALVKIDQWKKDIKNNNVKAPLIE